MRSLSWTGVVLLVLLVAACGKTEPEAAATQVSIEDLQYALLPGGGRIISGTLHNHTLAPIKNAQIQISLFDADNRYVSSMMVTVRNVSPGEQKPFRQPVDADEGVQGARVRSVLVL